MDPSWLEKAMGLSLHLTWWQQLGLAFLLGSFAVATLSDLKRMTMQRECLEVWVLFGLVVLGFEAYDVHVGKVDGLLFAIKWGLIGLLSVLSLNRVGVLFRLAIADVAALAAAASLFTPGLIAIFYLAARLLAWVLAPLLGRGQLYYPFMPVVSLTTLGVLGVGWLFR